MLKIRRSGNFNNNLRLICNDNEELLLLTNEKVKLFENNPHDTRLENHALRRRMKGKWAFSITNDIRIVYEWIGKGTVRFLAIGTHRQVYSKLF